MYYVDTYRRRSLVCFFLFTPGSCVVFVPVDVVKERLQVQRPSGIATSTALNKGGTGGSGGIGPITKVPMLPYRGSADTLKQILRTEGLRGIYKVHPPTGIGHNVVFCFSRMLCVLFVYPGGFEDWFSRQTI